VAVIALEWCSLDVDNTQDEEDVLECHMTSIHHAKKALSKIKGSTSSGTP
jgi:hypothetical protein